MFAEALAAATLICLDPGHGTPPAIGRQREPIGPGSRVTKIKDGGGAAGEAEVVLAIARRTRTLLLRRGYRVAMTRTGPTFRGGNIERAQFCNRRGAALMLRIHADGSSDPSRRGVSTLYPARRRGWTDDVYGPSLRAARAIQRSLVAATGAPDLGLVERSDLTGFNWADVPVVLAETGFMTNPREGRLLRSSAYQWRVARGLAAGVGGSVGKRAPWYHIHQPGTYRISIRYRWYSARRNTSHEEDCWAGDHFGTYETANTHESCTFPPMPAPAAASSGVRAVAVG